MVKKAVIISAILIVITIIVSIIISVVNSKPTNFISIVSYDSEIPVMKEAIVDTSKPDNETLLIENLLEHEKTVMFSSIIVVIIFTILFYGAKRSRS